MAEHMAAPTITASYQSHMTTQSRPHMAQAVRKPCPNYDFLAESMKDWMQGFIQRADRRQTTLLPECLDEWIHESHPVRTVDVFVDALDLWDLGFEGVVAEATGRPAYRASPLLKLYIYGYVNRMHSSRRLEREAGRNLEVMWLTGRLVPDHMTIADFRKESGPVIKMICAQFVALCRKMGLLTKASVAIDGSKFKAVNSRDNNFKQAKMDRRLAQIEESVARYLSQLDTSDHQTTAGEVPSEAMATTTTRLKEEVARLTLLAKQMLATPDQQISFTDSNSCAMTTSGRGLWHGQLQRAGYRRHD
jgi:transposase